MIDGDNQLICRYRRPQGHRSLLIPELERCASEAAADQSHQEKCGLGAGDPPIGAQARHRDPRAVDALEPLAKIRRLVATSFARGQRNYQQLGGFRGAASCSRHAGQSTPEPPPLTGMDTSAQVKGWPWHPGH